VGVLLSQELVMAAQNDHLRTTDQKVFKIISESDTGVSFQALKRTLGLHQESLSRSLKRLMEMGLVSKQESGYITSDFQEKTGKEGFVVVDSALPNEINPNTLTNVLKGRWFKGLRWFGMSLDGTKLVWSTLDGKNKVSLKILGQELVIQADSTSKEAVFAAIKLAHSVFEKIADLLQTNVKNQLLQTVT
jgi:hypothetical protein